MLVSHVHCRTFYSSTLNGAQGSKRTSSTSCVARTQNFRAQFALLCNEMHSGSWCSLIKWPPPGCSKLASTEISCTAKTAMFEVHDAERRAPSQHAGANVYRSFTCSARKLLLHTFARFLCSSSSTHLFCRHCSKRVEWKTHEST